MSIIYQTAGYVLSGTVNYKMILTLSTYDPKELPGHLQIKQLQGEISALKLQTFQACTYPQVHHEKCTAGHQAGFHTLVQNYK